MNILVLIGNGFDLAHGLRTQFNHFIGSASHLKEMYKHFQNGDGNWNDMERKFKELVVEELDTYPEEIDVEEETGQILDAYGTNEIGEVNYYDYQTDTFKQAIQAVSPVVYSLLNFESDFREYLRTNYSDSDIPKICRPILPIQKLLNNASKVINFNYTNTAELLYSCGSVEHIHGDINDEIVIGCDTFDRLQESMVLGNYPTSSYFGGSPKEFLIERDRFYEFDMEGTLVERESIRRFYDEIRYKNERNEEELLSLLKMRSKESLVRRQEIVSSLRKEYYDEVHIIGHSLGEADWSVFSAIKANKIICYFHDEDDKKQKQSSIEQNGWDITLQPDTMVFSTEPALL